ncbi:MAG: cell division protein SepF [Candidatus Bathyarchaeota archaeon]|nr:MAG: cell division protein SepF [Candidatus Bathyarchaeota archaeon]
MKALPLRDLEDVDAIKREVKSGNILILRVSPLARKNIEDVKRAVNELHEFTNLVGGDIARLGEERVVITPHFIRIWREKTVAPKQEMPTAA